MGTFGLRNTTNGSGQRDQKLASGGTLQGREMPMLASTPGVQSSTDRRMGLFSSLAFLLMGTSSGILLPMESKMFGFVRLVPPLQTAVLMTSESAWSHQE